jgi:hypothetical protein
MSASLLTIATIATSMPMGAEVYQNEVQRRASSALREVDDREWHVSRFAVRSMRSE